MKTEEIQYPIRINRYLYVTGLCSRREADRLIEQGKVFVNGARAVLGQKVGAKDTVTTSKDVSEREYRYFLYNKPRGVVRIDRRCLRLRTRRVPYWTAR
jgi:23S rRNA pseudouridine2604 synthase